MTVVEDNLTYCSWDTIHRFLKSESHFFWSSHSRDLLPQLRDYQHWPLCLAFKRAHGESNSGLQACKARTLLTEPPLQP